MKRERDGRREGRKVRRRTVGNLRLCEKPAPPPPPRRWGAWLLHLLVIDVSAVNGWPISTPPWDTGVGGPRNFDDDACPFPFTYLKEKERGGKERSSVFPPPPPRSREVEGRQQCPTGKRPLLAPSSRSLCVRCDVAGRAQLHMVLRVTRYGCSSPSSSSWGVTPDDIHGRHATRLRRRHRRAAP